MKQGHNILSQPQSVKDVSRGGTVENVQMWKSTEGGYFLPCTLQETASHVRSGFCGKVTKYPVTSQSMPMFAKKVW